MTVLDVGNGQRPFCVVGDERRQPLPPCTGTIVQVDDALGASVALGLARAGCRIFVLFGASAADPETEVDWVLQDEADETEDVVTATVESLAEALDLRPGIFPGSGDIAVALVSEGIDEIRERLDGDKAHRSRKTSSLRRRTDP